MNRPIKKKHPRFDQFLVTIYKEIKSKKDITFSWVKKMFWPSTIDLDVMEKEVLLNLYTGDLTDIEFSVRFGMEVREIRFIREGIMEKAIEFIMNQRPIDHLCHTIFRDMHLVEEEAITKGDL